MLIDPIFKAHKLNEKGIAKSADARVAFSELLGKLKTLCPDNSREFSIVKTKLEEASFFVNRAIAIVPENQVPQDQYD